MVVIADRAGHHQRRRGRRFCRQQPRSGDARHPVPLHPAEERLPGAAAQSDAELTAFIRATAETEYHPVGTCKMGNDAMAVVDERLRVRGIERLRVIDASIMPTLVSGNTNAPTIMIAEKGAEMMLAERG